MDFAIDFLHFGEYLLYVVNIVLIRIRCNYEWERFEKLY